MNNEAATQLVYLVAGAEFRMDIFRTTERLTGRNNDHPLVDGNGHTGMVNDLLPFAELVGKYIDGRVEEQEFPGVFEYEVTEALGVWIAETAEVTDSGVLELDFITKLDELGDKFFSQLTEYNQEKPCALI